MQRRHGRLDRMRAESRQVINSLDAEPTRKSDIAKYNKFYDVKPFDYEEKVGELLIRSGTWGFSFTSFPAILKQELDVMVGINTIKNWIKEVPHFKVCYDIFLGELDIWKRDLMLNPRKVRLMAGELIENDKGEMVPNKKTCVFKEEQVKMSYLNKMDDGLARDRVLYDREEFSDKPAKKDIIDLSPTKKNIEPWENKFKDNDVNRKLIADKVLKRLEES